MVPISGVKIIFGNLEYFLSLYPERKIFFLTFELNLSFGFLTHALMKVPQISGKESLLCSEQVEQVDKMQKIE